MTEPATSETGPAASETGETGGPDALLAELEWRGILHETTPGLPARLATGRPIAGYIGFDPSADSLHVGHLVPIFGLLRLQRFGGRPVAVVGGGTGMIGDPSGRSSERNLLDRATLEHNVGAIRGQLERFLDFSPGERGALMVDNLDWLGELTLVEFLRDVGKHFTVPYMLAKDSVQVRLERGLSFTEFSYMLLQAYDFAHLFETRGVELQMGGADQWGNITAGLELIRRTSGAGDGEAAHGLAYKLLLSPSGTKFGKSEGGESIWLDPARTSPYAFYQYWLNTDDRDVGTYLRWFTEFPRERIEQLESESARAPEARAAQRALALDITTRTHGTEPAARAVADSAAKFSSAPIDDPAVLRSLFDSAGGFEFDPATLAAGAATLLAAAGLFASKGEARRTIEGGGLTINGQRIADPAAVPEPIAGEWLDVRIGKRRREIGRRKG
ncbi:MAG TPA: tyrosine--tRNA ligase [Candidatus Limnocylindrales bacterium]|nr:tyrosine--tRNA ligase [Candidatus Limnocylindrales bacterium]